MSLTLHALRAPAREDIALPVVSTLMIQVAGRPA
jgi:hypothetical protein